MLAMHGFVLPVINTRSIGVSTELDTCECSTPDGSKFLTDSNGDIIFANYASGAVVSIHARYSAVRTDAGDFWIINAGGRAFRLD